jgi:acyl-CoA hydrolase
MLLGWVRYQVWGEDLLDPSVPRKLLTTGLFTFVSLGATGRVQPIPPLRLDTLRDRELFEEGQARYEENKKKRAAAGAGK